MHMVGVHEPDVIVRWLQRKVGGRGRRGLRHFFFFFLMLRPREKTEKHPGPGGSNKTPLEKQSPWKKREIHPVIRKQPNLPGLCK